MIKLLEPELHLKCRKEDLALIKELIPECEREFLATMEKEAPEGEYRTTLKLIESENMGPEDGGDCGGVIVFTPNRKIVCVNTLKSRLDLCFEELLPHIRKLLFPKRSVVAKR